MPIRTQAIVRFVVSSASAALVGATLLRPGHAQEQTLRFRTVERAIPNRYIVLLNEEPLRSQTGSERAAIASSAIELARSYAGQVSHVYHSALKGFAVQIPEGAARALSADPRVALVEEDAPMSISAVQASPPWGLDRIDQRLLPLDRTYTVGQTGPGTNVYVIDTGIWTTHAEFGGRASVAVDVVGGRNGIDCNGHGTNVAGTIGGASYGVAKSVRLFAVRVLDCSGSGTTSGVIAGVDWVTQYHDRLRPAVANMSLGGSSITALGVLSIGKAQGPLWRGSTTATMRRGSRWSERVGAAGAYVQIAAVGTNVTSYTVTDLTVGGDYYYRVRAYPRRWRFGVFQ